MTAKYLSDNVGICDSKVLFIKRNFCTYSGIKHETRIIVRVRLRNGESIVIYLPIEHKSSPDQNVMLQILEQFTVICKKTKSIVVPIILLCCKDKNFTIPNSYLRWVLRDHDTSSPEIQELLKWLPDFRCVVVNLHDIAPERIWQAGVPAGLMLYAMTNFWTANDDDVAKIIKKSRELNLDNQRYLIDSLIDYYQNTDNGYGREEFNRIERERDPNLPEEELLMPEILLGQERIRKEGVDEGVILGQKKGIALGQEKLILKMLKSGKMTDSMICEVAEISKEELAQLKRKL